MSMHAYARRFLQEVADVAVPPAAAAPSPSPADGGNQRSPSATPTSPTNTSPFNVSSQFSPAMIIILVILLSAFFFMGFFAIYVRRCTSDENFSPRGNTRSGTPRRHDGAALQRGLGVDPSLVESFPMVSYAAAKRKGCSECVVCLTDFERGNELKQLPKCKHVFHPDCIGMWLESHTTCPLCRRSLVNSDRWSLSWRWGGSSRRGSLSARLNCEGENSDSRRPSPGFDSSRGWRIRVPSRNGNASFHAQEAGDSAQGGSLFASPDLRTEMALPSSAPSTLLSSSALEIVAEDLDAAGCMSCSLPEVVLAQRISGARNNGASRLNMAEGAAATIQVPSMQGDQGRRSRLGRSNSTGHSLRKEAISRAAAVAMQAVPLVGGCMQPRLGQSPLHRSQSERQEEEEEEEEEAMVGPDAATSDGCPRSVGGCAGPA
ncbi:hypothetical protein L7F22_002245 [Adiantum nelumboides]|nr:hypothetical protein [Adiantum nelumboides]